MLELPGAASTREIVINPSWLTYKFAINSSFYNYYFETYEDFRGLLPTSSMQGHMQINESLFVLLNLTDTPIWELFINRFGASIYSGWRHTRAKKIYKMIHHVYCMVSRNKHCVFYTENDINHVKPKAGDFYIKRGAWRTQDSNYCPLK